MLKIHNLTAKTKISNKEILKNLNLEFKPGEIHYIEGKNGSGKTSFANMLMGVGEVEAVSGSIALEDELFSDVIKDKVKLDNYSKIDLLKLSPTERSLLGIFLSYQYPLEIPGVSMLQYLRMIYNLRQETPVPVFKFREVINKLAEDISFPKELLDRNLNEDFSGGEKKKSELLQAFLAQPKYLILDELDSGLDKSSVKKAFEAIAKYKKSQPELCVIIITHYDFAKSILEPDEVHEIEGGTLIN